LNFKEIVGPLTVVFFDQRFYRLPFLKNQEHDVIHGGFLMKTQRLVIAACGAVLVLGFQNCSKMSFSPAADQAGLYTDKTSGNGSDAAEGDNNNNGQSGNGANGAGPSDVIDIGVVKNFACKSFVEIPYGAGQVLDIPARDENGLCFVVKIIGKAKFDPSDSNPHVDTDVFSRNHGPGPSTHHPFDMGSEVVRMVMEGGRSIKLSGGKNDKTKITVDNFILVGIAPSSMVGDPAYYKAYGTSDSAVYGSSGILFKDVNIPVKAFATGGVSTIEPLSLDGMIEVKREYSLDVRALDAGASGAVSDIYILFQ
jgi:hypothetical protein